MIQNCELRPGASIGAIKALVAQYPCFPEMHISMLIESNGFEGFVGESYVQMWAAEEVIECNQGYHVDEFAPGVVLVGTNLGGEGFAIDMRAVGCPYVNIPMCPLSLEDLRPIGITLEECLKTLHRGLFD